MAAHAPYVPDTPPGGFVSGTQKTRRAQVAFGGTGFGLITTNPFEEAHQRIPFRIPVATTRWRIRIRNKGADENVQTGAIAFNGIWMGKAATNSTTGLLNGDFQATPSQAITSFSTASDASEYVSGWVTDSTLQFDGDSAYMVSMGWTGAPVNVAKGCGRIYYTYGVGKSADAATTAVGASVDSRVFFDIRLEYEFSGYNLVGIAIGDSLTEGHWGDSPFLPQHWSWHGRYALRNRTPMCASGYQGSRMSDWTDATKWKWTRWTGSGLTIDFAIIYLGSNDCKNSVALATSQAALKTIVANFRAAGVSRVYLATTTPRNDFSHAYLNADHASGVSAFTVDTVYNANIGAAEVIQLGQGANQETLTVSSVTGTGPYTINTTGSSTKAHVKGVLIAGALERTRQQLNDWIRSAPFDVDGVFDFAHQVHEVSNQARAAENLVGADGIHFRPEGYNRIANAVVGALVR